MIQNSIFNIRNAENIQKQRPPSLLLAVTCYSDFRSHRCPMTKFY